MTNFGNFKSIINSGLLCSHGSRGGAGRIMANGAFEANEIGYVLLLSLLQLLTGIFIIMMSWQMII